RPTHVLQAEPADVDGEPRARELGKARLVASKELGPPIDVDITGLSRAGHLRLRRHEQELLVRQSLDDQPRTALRRIEHGNVHASLDERLHQLLLEADLRANRDVRARFAQGAEAGEEHAFPNADSAAEGQRRSKALRDARILSGALDGAEQGGRMLLEQAAGRGQGRACLIALEKPAAEMLLEG